MLPFIAGLMGQRRTGRETASGFTVEDVPWLGADKPKWWHRNTLHEESSETQRSVAYLRA